MTYPRMRPLATVCVGAATAWGLAVILCADILAAPWRMPAGAIFLVLAAFLLFAIRRGRWRWQASVCFGLALLATIDGWASIEPSNARDWMPEVAMLAYATMDGDRVTIHNIRNFEYQSETDFVPRYYDRTFDIGQLTSVDLIAVYWMGPAVAHTMLSFGFADGNHLAISIETRKEVGEGYSTWRGLFRHYELYYVVADERDVIRLRTTYRNPPEDVYVFRVQGPVESGRRLFRAYLERMNALAEQPAFYNTLLDNCTTGVWLNSLVNPGHLPLSWKLIASGYTPEYLYENGRLEQRLPFADLRSRSLVNAAAREAADAPDFSRRIRAGLPGMDQ